MKTLKGIATFISLMCVALVTYMSVVAPTSILDAFGITVSSKDNIASVPYFINFDDANEGKSGYKSQYIIDNKNYWYCSWGNASGAGNLGFVLGWNTTSQPIYGNYTHNKDAVTKNITLGENDHYSYLLMDFDFNKNHMLTVSYDAHDNGFSYSSIYLIKSTDNGKSWNLVEEQQPYVNGWVRKFETAYDPVISTGTVRYGLIVRSSLDTFRVKIKDFYAQRITL